MSLPAEATMRAAIKARDPAYDGRFVYGVVTTGVFCRPSCASRPARPENLRFFAETSAATTAGFRPCRRCRPMGDGAGLERLIDVARHIEAHSDEALPLAELAGMAGMSASHLQRLFKRSFGISPRAFRDAVRARTLKDSLKSGDDVTGAIFGAGYGSTSRVYGEAARHIGMTPSAYREGGAGESISYACRRTALGSLLMAATARGVCFVQFGPGRKALVAQLRKEFPKAELQPSPAAASAELDDWIAALDEHISADGPRPDLPLDLRGTALQMAVWRFLLTVPEGEVVSYGELAAAIDRPRAARAVASACARNRVGVLVPCHRVLRGDGALGGYRWGLKRKRALLDAERGRARS